VKKLMAPANSRNKRSFSTALKLAYTTYFVVHVWFNWRVYGPLNFLWECDVAVLTILIALWTESRLLTSIAAIAALLPMGLWIADMGARILLGHYVFGFAGYMFDRRIPRIIRFISAFHLWLPLMLIWMVSKTGYDRKAVLFQSLFMTVLLITCRLVSQPPPEHSMHEAVNINWVYGTSDNGPQTKLPPAVYLALMIVLYPLLIYIPTHLTLSLIFGKRASTSRAAPFNLILAHS
jgi:hypothetical protein